MLQLSRRFVLGGLLAAPAIIRIPGLLMPLGRSLERLIGPAVEITDETGERWFVPIVGGKAVFTADHSVKIQQAVGWWTETGRKQIFIGDQAAKEWWIRRAGGRGPGDVFWLGAGDTLNISV